jgi:hypothetical protein
MSDDDREQVARARLNGEKHPELLEAFEEATDDRTMAEVVREALRSDLLGGEEDMDGLSGPARQGLRILRDSVDGRTGIVEVGVAKSRVAAATNIKKESVKSAIFGPLRSEGYITVSSRTQASYIVVLPPGVRTDPESDEERRDGDRGDLWKAQERTTKEKIEMYRSRNLEPPEELIEEADAVEAGAD